jgi:hypothetical protein
MQTRKLKVGNRQIFKAGRMQDNCEIVLRGKWLLNLGFRGGESVTIQTNIPGELIIRKVQT